MTTIIKAKVKKSNDSVQNTSWTMHDEELFIDGLGKRKNGLSRKIILPKYIDFMTNVRVNFDKLNKDHLIKYAQKELDRIK